MTGISLEKWESTGPLQIDRETAKLIFNNRIIPELGIAGKTPPAEPTFVVVAGQIGSNVSTAAEQAMHELEGATAHIVPQNFDKYLPKFHRYRRYSPFQAAPSAAAAGSDLFRAAAIQHAIEKRANILCEETRPDNIAKLAAEASANGYNTKLYLVAAPLYRSITHMNYDTIRALKIKFNTDYIPENTFLNIKDPIQSINYENSKIYDKKYAELNRAAFNAEKENQFDCIFVTDNNGNKIYENEQLTDITGNNYWKIKTDALGTIISERHKAITDESAAEISKEWSYILNSDQINQHKEFSKQEIEQTHRQIMAYIWSEASRYDPKSRNKTQLNTEEIWRNNIRNDLKKIIQDPTNSKNIQFKNAIREYISNNNLGQQISPPENTGVVGRKRKLGPDATPDIGSTSATTRPVSRLQGGNSRTAQAAGSDNQDQNTPERPIKRARKSKVTERTSGGDYDNRSRQRDESTTR